ncbi:MAG TPA: MOSC domain-containing protein [Thermoanaerobaculia bacterium]|nr:MOSC domain-containing protein [Thermoanaerobaculia bacterium]
MTPGDFRGTDNIGEVRAIWLKRFKRGPMDLSESANLRAGKGLVGNANQGGRRQVILLEEEAWRDALADLGVETSLDPAARRANLLLAGVRLEGTRGRILRLGTCRLRIFTECTPCERMEEAHPGLQAALRSHWRGGACAEVLEGGEIRVGDEVAWEEERQMVLLAGVRARISNPQSLR